VVTAVIVTVAVLMAFSDAFAPGLFVPVVQLSPGTVPRATPALLIFLVTTAPRRVWVTVTVVLTVLAARPWSPAWDLTPLGLLATLLPALAALYFDARRRLVQSLRDRAERAEREQHLLADAARADERRRLAADMHDVVTHRISLIVLHAGALETSATREVRTAAGDIRTAGAQALTELRDLVGVLRTEPDGTGPAPEGRGGGAPEHGDPAEPARESAAAGLPVDLDVEGSPDALAPTVARTAYRVVQEALTNVRKHAPGARTGVRVRYGPDRVEIRVANAAGPDGPDPSLAGTGSGSGLAGLEQRVGLVGGTLRHGPTDDGGFAVDATLPVFVPTAGGDTAR
jgi:signal transduction histidine kinase